MKNKMLEYLCDQGLAKWIKGDDDVSIYEIGKIWVSVKDETDTFNQKVRAIGMNEKNEVGEHMPFVKREGWHFSELAAFEITLCVRRRYEYEAQERVFTVHFQYLYERQVIRCIVCEEGDEIWSTDYECWEDIEGFLSQK